MGELKPIGRPSRFTQDLADTICQRLAEGQSLRSICLAEDIPHMATICRWLGDERHAAFREQYARAREAQADTLFDEILDIADDGSNDWMERRLPNGDTVEVLNAEHVQRSKLRIDSRKWMAGKLLPKKYGEKIGLEHSGPDGTPLEVTFTRRAGDAD